MIINACDTFQSSAKQHMRTQIHTEFFFVHEHTTHSPPRPPSNLQTMNKKRTYWDIKMKHRDILHWHIYMQLIFTETMWPTPLYNQQSEAAWNNTCHASAVTCLFFIHTAVHYWVEVKTNASQHTQYHQSHKGSHKSSEVTRKHTGAHWGKTPG